MSQPIAPTRLRDEEIRRGSAWTPQYDMYQADGRSTRGEIAGAAYTFVHRIYNLSGTLIYSRSTANASEAAKDGSLTYRWHAKYSSVAVDALTADEYVVEVEETNTGASPTGPYLVARGRLFVRD